VSDPQVLINRNSQNNIIIKGIMKWLLHFFLYCCLRST